MQKYFFFNKLKKNLIKKKVDLLIYNFYYISSEVIKHLIYKKKTDYFTKFEVPQIILTKKNYKCVHFVNLSVNLFDDTV